MVMGNTLEGRPAALDATACSRHDRFVSGVAGALLLALSMVSSPVMAGELRIAGLSDLNFGRWNGSRDMSGTVTHCVHSSVPGAQFAVSVNGDGPGGSYELRDGRATIPFYVDYNDGRGWVEALPGRAVAGQRGFGRAEDFRRCLGGAMQRQALRVRIFNRDLASAHGGSYSGRISLLVMPE